MRLPFKPSLLKVRRKKIKWIILHHTVELYPSPEAKIDNAKFQLPFLYNNAIEQNTADINYHFVIEKIKNDYHAITTRPFSYLCQWDDISPDINERAAHVALLGSYDFKIPEVRLLEVLSYKILNPLLKIFAIPPSRIKLHRDVSDNKELTCPGDFIDLARIQSLVRRYVIK